jgi:hypothetical protein
MPVETNTPHTVKQFAKKPLQEHPRSCRASGARPAGPLSWPHGKTLATRREECPISRLQHLRGPDGCTHRCSGATVGDSHKVPLNNQGKLAYNLQKAQIMNQLTHLKHIQDTTTTLVAPAACQGDAADAPRVRSASLEG